MALRLSYPELHQGVELDVRRLSNDEGGELTALVGRKRDALYADGASQRPTGLPSRRKRASRSF